MHSRLWGSGRTACKDLTSNSQQQWPMRPAPQPSSSVFRVGQGHQHADPVFYWRPFSNLPARRVLGTLQQIGLWNSASPQHVAALFLGCTDPRTIISSLSALQLAEGSQQLQLTAVLNDVHAPILARTALLLFMAAELDPESKADMQLLYDVWFNTTWHADTWPRFKGFVQRLHDSSVPWISCARPEDQQQLQEVWRWWLDEKHPNRPTPDRLHKDRASYSHAKEFRKCHFLSCHAKEFRKCHLPSCPDELSLADLQAHQVLEHAALPMLVDPCEASHDQYLDMVEVSDAIKTGTKHYLQSGSLSWDGSCREAGGATSSNLVNITFVEPGTGAWNVHPDLRPFTCWGTYSADQLKEVDMQSPGVLARAFIARMAGIIKGFQCNTRFGMSKGDSTQPQQVALQVQLMCGEALGLCLHNPFTQVGASTTAAQGTGNNSSSDISTDHLTLPCVATFDIIDTGSLCDDVGLLPLLVAVTPRLSNHPAARLHTVPATWAVGAPRMDYYLQEQALGMPLTMTPTLLGLRLVTDTIWGRPTAHSAYCVEENLSDPRELPWAPVQPSQPRPQLHLPTAPFSGNSTWGPPGSIPAVLQNVCKLCCTTDHGVPPHADGDVHLNLSTPQTFAWLLASCIPRLDMSSVTARAIEQPFHTSSQSLHSPPQPFHGSTPSLLTADVFLPLWALRAVFSALLPDKFRMAFQGAIDAVRASLQSTTGSAAAEAAGVPLCSSQPLLLLPIPYGNCGPESGRMGFLRRPYVRALLFSEERTGLHAAEGTSVSEEVSTLSFTDSFVVTAMAYESPAGDAASRSRVLGQDCHVLDCCMLYQWGSEWQAAFLLPADFDAPQLPAESSVLCSGGSASPHTNQVKPAGHVLWYISERNVSPFLAHCLLGPCLQQTHCQPGDTAAAAGNVCPSLGPSLQVMSLQEDAFSYKVVLKLPGQGPASGLSVKLMQGAAATGAHMSSKCTPSLCPSSHVVQVTLKQPADVSTQLVLGWPVAAGLGEPEAMPYDYMGKELVSLTGGYSSGYSVTIKLSESEGTVQLTLAKAQVCERWPEDQTQLRSGAPLKQALKQQALQSAGQSMFTYDESCAYSKAMQSCPSGKNTADKMFDAGNMLVRHLIYSSALQSLECSTPVMITLDVSHGTALPASRTLHILLSPDWLMDAENGHTCMIPAVVVDMRLSYALMCEREGKQVSTTSAREQEAAAVHFQLANLLENVASKKGPFTTRVHKLRCKEDLDLVRRYLWHNAQCCEPDEWQRCWLKQVQPYTHSPVPCMLPYFATFVSPMHVEHMQGFAYNKVIFAKQLSNGVPSPGQLLPYPLKAVDSGMGISKENRPSSSGSNRQLAVEHTTDPNARLKAPAVQGSLSAALSGRHLLSLSLKEPMANSISSTAGRAPVTASKVGTDNRGSSGHVPTASSIAAFHEREQWILAELPGLRTQFKGFSDKRWHMLATWKYASHRRELRESKAPAEPVQLPRQQPNSSCQPAAAEPTQLEKKQPSSSSSSRLTAADSVRLQGQQLGSKADTPCIEPNAARCQADAMPVPGSTVTSQKEKKLEAARAAATEAACAGSCVPCTAQEEDEVDMKTLLWQMYGDNVPDISAADAYDSTGQQSPTQEYDAGSDASSTWCDEGELDSSNGKKQPLVACAPALLLLADTLMLLLGPAKLACCVSGAAVLVVACKFMFGSKKSSAPAPAAVSVPALGREQWVMEKLSQLKAVLPNSSNEELRCIAEQAYMAHKTEGTQADAAPLVMQAKPGEETVVVAHAAEATSAAVTGKKKEKGSKAAKAAAVATTTTGGSACTAQDAQPPATQVEPDHADEAAPAAEAASAASSEDESPSQTAKKKKWKKLRL